MRPRQPISEDAARLGAAIRARRERLALGQDELAQLVGGLDQSDVSRIERGIRFPSIPQLAKLAGALKTTSSRLLARCRPARGLKARHTGSIPQRQAGS